jgi:hypothetical protein
MGYLRDKQFGVLKVLYGDYDYDLYTSLPLARLVRSFFVEYSRLRSSSPEKNRRS